MGGLGNLRRLRLTALSSNPLTALMGFKVLNGMGTQRRPLYPLLFVRQYVPAGTYSILNLGIFVFPNTMSRKNVNIRDKIFQDALIKKFRVLLGVEILSAIPHSIPHKSLWKIMRKRMRNILYSTRTELIKKWHRKICKATTRNIQ